MFRKIRQWFARDQDEQADKDYVEHIRRFQEILNEEHQSIDARRKAQGRQTYAWPDLNPELKGGAERPMYDVAGLALSGGGIRSAAFCLGALQSLAVAPRRPRSMPPAQNSLFDCLDYLSTVSGGGYIGCSVSAAMSAPTSANQAFPFAEPDRYDDEPAVGHLRDYSNYLLPRGSQSLADVVGVLLRGLATNLVFILAGVFFCATFTILAYRSVKPLNEAGSFLPRLAAALIGLVTGRNPLVHELKFVRPFGLTGFLLIAFGIYLVAWALLRSRPLLRFFGAFGGPIGAMLRRLSDGLFSDVRGVFIKLARLFIFTIALTAFLDLQPYAIQGFAYIFKNGIAVTFTAVTAPFAGVVAFFSNRLSGYLKTSSFETGTSTIIKRMLVQAAVIVAAAILPLLLYAFYLWVTAAGIWKTGVYLPGCSASHCWLWMPGFGNVRTYFLVWLVFFLPTIFFAPNANSLHQLYRDKLSKAFLFNPLMRAIRGPDSGDLEPRDRVKLSAISPPTGGPYHLINAAINLQGSIQANRRGRDASFFLFSSKFVGSDVTNYIATRNLEDADPHVDLGAAMAISGAAVSSNMGSSSIAPLSPTLALLNIRLGYWMANPKYLRDGLQVRFRRGVSDLLKTYLFLEMFGQLDENQPHIYLTDGGHIENLGVYQLLKRHCRLIVAVDGECDPNLSFHALSLVERYARIDLGIRIDIPWQKIADAANAATELAEQGKPIPNQRGPHCAVGTIFYPGGEKGVLLYVKASLTGDEPDYVVDYKMRNPVFPHESTGDQFFSEEQFEVYRALGFHALSGFLDASREYESSPEIDSEAAAVGKSVPDYVRDLFSD